MRRILGYGCVILGLLPATAFCQKPVVKETQALDVLQRSVSSMGGGLPNGLSASGNVVTFESDREETGTGRISALGLDAYSEEWEIAGASTTLISLGRRGLTKANGIAKGMRPANFLCSRHAFVPAAKLAAAALSGQVAIYSEGSEKAGAATFYKIRLEYLIPTDDSEDKLAPACSVSVLIDASTFLPSQMAFNYFSSDAPNDPIPMVISYANWQQQGALLFPMEAGKSLNGSPHSKITFTKVDANPGLTAAQFQVQ